LGSSDEVTVENETALRAAVNSAVESTTIALTADIALTGSALNIPAGKDIMLVSDKADGFWKLIGATDQATISVDGILTLNGIIVTHIGVVTGNGVTVNSGGVFTLSAGEISNNIFSDGGGVHIGASGSFTMYGGVISNNTAMYGGNGGGVYVGSGSFNMLGGVIANNTVMSGGFGGGVYIGSGSFNMFSGAIAGNVVDGVFGIGVYGGGVYIESGSFSMSSGVISNNIVAGNPNGGGGGGGVYISSGSFSLSGDAQIVGNIADVGCGVLIWLGGFFSMSDDAVIANNTGGYLRYGCHGVYNTGRFVMSGGTIANHTASISDGGAMFITANGVFVMSGGLIANNTAMTGGGVFSYGSFSMSGGIIANNTATRSGGGVYIAGSSYYYSSFEMSGGTIADNTAIGSDIGGNGGGVYVSNEYFNTVFKLLGGVISGNVASVNGGGIWVTDTNTLADFERLTVAAGVVFENNRASGGYNRVGVHDAIYTAQIKSTRWTEPFTQGYNNYDISYTAGAPITPAVTVHSSYTSLSGDGRYLVGTSVTVNAGSRVGYTFSGWTVNEGSITLSNSVTETFTMPAHDVVVTANWSPISYTINYVLNSGGTNAAGNPSSYNVGNTFPIPINNPSRSGYEFLSWNVLYTNGSQVSSQSYYNIPAGTTGNIELTANWRVADTGGSDGSSPTPSPSPSASSEPTPSPTPTQFNTPSIPEVTTMPGLMTPFWVIVLVVIAVFVVVIIVLVVLLLRKGSNA